MERTIEVICAWCTEHYADKPDETPIDHPMAGMPTHGICPDCYVKHFTSVIVDATVKLNDVNITGTVKYLSIKHREPVYHIKLDGFPQTVVRERSGFEVIR